MVDADLFGDGTYRHQTKGDLMFYIAHIYAESGNINAVWSGGPYIDIYMGDEDVPRETINVWDYEKDKPFIKQSGKELCVYLVRWIRDYLDVKDIRGYRFEQVSEESPSFESSEE